LRLDGLAVQLSQFRRQEFVLLFEGLEPRLEIGRRSSADFRGNGVDLLAEIGQGLLGAFLVGGFVFAEVALALGPEIACFLRSGLFGRRGCARDCIAPGIGCGSLAKSGARKDGCDGGDQDGFHGFVWIFGFSFRRKF
jgi:hypothetical protein